MTFQSLPNLTFGDVPRPRLGVASGVYNTCRQDGLALSAAILLSRYQRKASSPSKTPWQI